MADETSIKKHVAIIHAYSLMSILQRKIVNVLLYEAVKQNVDSKNNNSVAIECRIPFSNIYKAINFNSNNSQYVKEAIDDLASLKIEWNLLKDKIPTDISFLNLRILHGSPTFYQDRTINFSFHKMVIDLLKNPPIYGTVDLEMQSYFESKYSHALYENGTRFVHLKKNKIIQLEVFRKLLGVQSNKYKDMREFKRNVMSPAMEEVNDRADFILDLKNIKAGKKIAAFELCVTAKKNNLVKSTEKFKIAREAVANEIIKNFGELNSILLEKMMAHYSNEYLLEKIDYIKKHAKQENSGFYPIRYFISALKNNYQVVSPAVTTELKKDNLLTTNNEWESKFQHLQSDLNHWKKMLDYANSSKNNKTIGTIEQLVKKCELSLQQHIKLKRQQD